MLKKLSLSLSIIFLPLMAFSASTLQFNSASLKATGFNNAASNAVGGLSYGIIIDTTGNGFYNNGINYNGFTMPVASAGTFLARGDNAVITDDFFFWNGQTTLASITGTDGGNNALSTSFANIPNGSNGVSAGDSFAIIWFDTNSMNGSKYGFLTDPIFTVPNDTATISVASAAVFSSSAGPSLNILGVPEPSRIILAGLGLVGFIFRRRR